MSHEEERTIFSLSAKINKKYDFYAIFTAERKYCLIPDIWLKPNASSIQLVSQEKMFVRRDDKWKYELKAL